jgi:hypothetical protein
MIFAVQFVSLTAQLDLPDAHSSFRDLGTGFAWANFQVKPPFRINYQPPVETDDDDLLLLSLDDDVGVEEEEVKTNPMTEYLESLDMTAEELFLSNLLLGILGFFAFRFVHMQFISFLEARMRKKLKKPEFKLPALLQYPAPEILLFFMYYNGIIQSCLTVIVAPGVLVSFRVLGSFALIGVMSIVVYFMLGIRRLTGLGTIHHGKSDKHLKKGETIKNPQIVFLHKHDDSHSSFHRFRRLLSEKHTGKHGKWEVIGDDAKKVVGNFDSVFKKLGPNGIMFYVSN